MVDLPLQEGLPQAEVEETLGGEVEVEEEEELEAEAEEERAPEEEVAPNCWERNLEISPETAWMSIAS